MAQANDRAIANKYEMEQVELHHQHVMAARAAHREVERCFLEADMAKIGIDSSLAQIQSRLAGVSTALLTLSNLIAQVQQYALEGPAALAREQGRSVPAIAHHYFVDKKAAEFERTMLLARWYTYLAVVATEHDFQLSLDLRGKTIAAAHPDELSQVLDRLEVVRTPRQILPRAPQPGQPVPAGRNPQELVMVVSLRDRLLGLYDRTTSVPGGEPPDQAVPALTATARFQARLWDPAHAMYDETGAYLGQGIPFHIPVRGELIDRCAERLWRVNATVSGPTAGARVTLKVLQRNSFESQVCRSTSDPPVLAGGHVGTSDQALGFTPAHISAWLNIPRLDFEKQAYVEGSSDVLAGRGLYADYVLLFPWNGVLDSGFRLDQVEDVLLRFDYLSVDDLLWL
jgi:hypothetical protein